MTDDKKKYPAGIFIVVDPDADTQAASIEILNEAGFEVRACASGDRAIKLVEGTPKDLRKPQFIIVDAILSGMSGFEVVRRLAEKYAGKDLLILMMSKYDSTEDILEAQGAGARALLKKPLTLENIKSAIEDNRMRKLKSEIGDMVFQINYE